MEIDFANSRIERDCCSFAAMKKKFGERRAEVLNTRLKSLEEASCLEELRNSPGHWHELTQNRRGQIAANVGQGCRLIIVPSEEKTHRRPSPTEGWIGQTLPP